ncbi:hypothetical protein LH438_10850, partial [Laribacter hongkongensis]|nr:hypothetical protein [Laribacter hongkongensis]
MALCKPFFFDDFRIRKREKNVCCIATMRAYNPPRSLNRTGTQDRYNKVMSLPMFTAIRGPDRMPHKQRRPQARRPSEAARQQAGDSS